MSEKAHPLKRILAVLAVGLTAWAMTAPAGAAHFSSVSRIVDKTAAAHPNALWHIVHDLCVTDMNTSGNPAPCAVVDLDQGFAVLKDIQGATQYLLLPTARVTGIESPRSTGKPDSPQLLASCVEGSGSV